jgi:hypothetical protein
VPAVSVGGEAKLTLKKLLAPLVLNGTVPEARSAPVGRLLAAFLIEITTFGGVPVQEKQKRSTSTFVA